MLSLTRSLYTLPENDLIFSSEVQWEDKQLQLILFFLNKMWTLLQCKLQLNLMAAHPWEHGGDLLPRHPPEYTTAGCTTTSSCTTAAGKQAATSPIRSTGLQIREIRDQVKGDNLKLGNRAPSPGEKVPSKVFSLFPHHKAPGNHRLPLCSST